MAAIIPFWTQPSHPDIMEVRETGGGEQGFSKRSFSKVTVAPFGVFARMEFPPCTDADDGPTYATVQYDKDRHLNLNSDLLYINHSCEPTLIFDTGNLLVLAGPNGLKPGDELTFFYPSTEWDMKQSFDCICAKPTCRGTISGARSMSLKQLDGLWINGHIREMMEAQHKYSVQHNGHKVHEVVGSETVRV